MQIKAEGLKFVYGKGSAVSSHALNGVDLLVDEKEFYGIIGKTGSGKSTFIQHLNGLLKVQKESGKVIIGEFDLADKNCDFKLLRKKVGMVFQYPEYQLFAETVFEDVAFGIRNFMPDTTQDQTTELVAVGAHTLNVVESLDHVAPRSSPSYAYLSSNSSVEK